MRFLNLGGQDLSMKAKTDLERKHYQVNCKYRMKHPTSDDMGEVHNENHAPEKRYRAPTILGEVSPVFQGKNDKKKVLPLDNNRRTRLKA